MKILVYFEPFPKRILHVSWLHDEEVYLMGGHWVGIGSGPGTTTSLLPQPPGSTVVPGFPLVNPVV